MVKNAMDLYERYTKIFAGYVSNETEVTALWEEVKDAYQQKFRKYHNLDHLNELFGYCDAYKNRIEYTQELLLAIFYHDYSYSIWKKDNEEKSALKAIQVLRNVGYNSEGIHRIESLILCTKHHNGTSSDENYLIDFDLAILGQSEEVYQEYALKIRNEYAKVPGVLYRKGRKKVLHHFLDKPAIYQTSLFKTNFELQARVNLSNELNRL